MDDADVSLGKPRDWDEATMGPCPSLDCKIVIDPDTGPEFRSIWAPSQADIAVLVAGGRVRLSIVGRSHPPVMLECVRHGDGEPAELTLTGFARAIGLSPETASALNAFALAMAGKLRRAELKHGWDDDWRTADPGALRSALVEHLAKGDPIDVANFCLFLSAQGERTA